MNATNPTSRLFLIASLALSLLTGSFTTPAFSATDSARKCCQPEARSTCCGMACCQTPIPQHDRTPLPNEKSSSGRDLAGFDSGLPVSGAPSLVALHVLLRV